MEITKIDPARLRNDEHFQFHTEFRDLMLKEDALKFKAAAKFSESYVPLFDIVDEALKKIKKSEFTAKIKQADRLRDEIWAGMVEMNTTALKHFDPKAREAAVRLKIVFDTYGNIAKKPLNEQTSAVYNVLQELQGKYADDCAAVGITQWTNELKERNNTVDALMKDRFYESAAKSDIVLREARVKLDEVYRETVKRIHAYALIEGAADYEQFIKTFNVIIAKYTAQMKRRRGKGGVREHAAAPDGVGANY